MLQCAAVYCSMLQCVAVHWVFPAPNPLPPSARRSVSSVLQCVAVCCSVLHCFVSPAPNPLLLSAKKCVLFFVSLSNFSRLVSVFFFLHHVFFPSLSAFFFFLFTCRVLQGVAVCCSVLQCVAVCGNGHIPAMTGLILLPVHN